MFNFFLKHKDYELLKRGLKYLAPYRLKVFLTFICSLGSLALGLIQPIMWAKLLTYLFKYQLHDILAVLVQLGFIMIGELILSYLTNYLYCYLNESIVFDLKRDMYAKLLDLPVRAFDNKRVGEFISRIHTDAGAVSQAITRQLIELIMNICKVIFIGAIVFRINVALGLIILAAFPLSSISFLLFGKKLRAKNEARAKLSDKYFSDVQETVQGIREVKALGLKAERFKSFLQLSSNIRILNIKVQNISSIAQNFTQSINYISNLVVLCVGSYFTYSRTLSMENFIAFASYSTQFTDSLISVTQTQATVQQIMTSLERMFELMDNLNYAKDFQGNKILGCMKGKIEINNLSFSYVEDKPVLQNVSLKLGTNQKIALVGRSGSGKTTLFNLLLRFYKSSSGKITIDGIDIDELEESSFRQNISVVRQDPFLFSMSIKDNLRLVRPNATEEEIETVCKTAFIHDFIIDLPQGYDTIVGDNAVTLSGGQKQRIAIARALLRDSKIILFDEATSALDNESQYKIKEAFDEISKNHTIIMIAHRLLTVVQADEILLMDEGKIVDRGTHRQLLNSSDLYKQLYKMELDIITEESYL